MVAIETTEAVSAANRAYYEAFETRNLDAMSDVWEHTDRVTCTHPGWVRLKGWSEVASAFMALFNGNDSLQFVLTEEQIQVDGRVAWVSVDENLLGEQGGATVSSVNIFVDSGYGNWKMVSHIGSLVSPPIEDED